MRLWSIHPKHLDSKGLVALWREGLLAKAVLEGKTKGYKNHPQLARFRNQKDAIQAINAFLWEVATEAKKRGYKFDTTKLGKKKKVKKISVTTKQILYEFNHLKKKLKVRDKNKHKELKKTKRLLTHPIFKKRKGDIEEWEKVRT